ncbi:MAG: Unknown protein [uncultured Campylobacterales bacterium]|uniref:Integral membrane protein n=1 Tax=uncultured Campylobacterales bacterium TaxID=352960 RepID=A0A6S6T7B2_9BACT|nr:MAG: Unknown protein [uncultured Campylobacterales bacterium]
MDKLYYTLFIFVYIFILVFNIESLSISIYEIELLQDSHLNGFWIRLISLFDIKYSFLLLHIVNLYLMYRLSLLVLNTKKEAFYSLILFALLPSVSLLGVIVNMSSIVIFITLLFLITFINRYFIIALYILFCSLFVDNSFFYLYISLFIYGISRKNYAFIYISLAFIMSSIGIYDIDIGGRPRGYFLTSFGMFLAIFSPFVFLYFCYSLYRVSLTTSKNIIWHISFYTFVIALLLSFRQKIDIEDFGVFLVIFIPIMVKVFFHSFNSHIKELRFKYKLIGQGILISAILSFLITFLNKPLFLLLENPNNHFAYKYYIVKELSTKLKQNNIYEVSSSNKSLQKRLGFYEIKKGKNILYENKPTSIKDSQYLKTIDIKYLEKKVKTYYVILPKINKRKIL